MIKLVERTKTDETQQETKLVWLEVDGVTVAGYSFFGADQNISLTIDFPELREKITKHCFSDLPNEVRSLQLLWDDEFPKAGQDWRITSLFALRDNDGHFTLEAKYLPYLPNWRRSYSIVEWASEVGRIISADQTGLSNIGSDEHLNYRLQYVISDPLQNIGDSLDLFCQKLQEIVNSASENLDNDARQGTLSTYFSFPPETQSACEQYLLYFGEFLRDLGIDTSIQLREEAGRVLFSVTPQNKEEALDCIREALEVYIGLPVATFVSSDDHEYRLEIQKLEANVMHFKSQLILAHAVLETKQSTIDSLRERVDYQSQILEGRILIESKQEQFESQGDKEELLKGTVAITTYKGKGIEINLPKLYRMLMDLFHRKE